MSHAQVGMIGLAVMGANLAKNLERNGYSCAVYNRTFSVTEKFISENNGKNFLQSKTVEEFVSLLERPRRMFIMVQAGAPVDAVIEQLLGVLDKGDIIIDGGNSYFEDTIRREKLCTEKGVNFLGVGISGGEEGALNGPSLMPGGPRKAWELIAPMLDKIAAKADGSSCTGYVGPDGSGHFVKMVHNGIEYGDMQLIAEAYDLLRTVGKCTPIELAKIFTAWNQGVLQSYLIEITGKIFHKKDTESEGYLVDKILDKAGQKGTGKWTAQVALDLGVAIPTISAAVDARVLSSMKAERVIASKELKISLKNVNLSDKEKFISLVHDALYTAKIMSYAQGMALLSAASSKWSWDLNLSEIASMWKGGCIIRAKFLGEITKAFKDNSSLPNLLLSPSMKKEVIARSPALREIVGLAAADGVAIPALGASLGYFDQYRTESLPQNLTQAQRDFFGAHTFERTDKQGSFHAHWE